MRLFVGGGAVMLGVLGLLLTATAGAMITVFTFTDTETTTDPEGDAIAPGLFTIVSILACVGLFVALALLVRGLLGGHDAGRSVTAWLSGVTVPWALLMAFFFGVVRYGDDFSVRSQ